MKTTVSTVLTKIRRRPARKRWRPRFVSGAGWMGFIVLAGTLAAPVRADEVRLENGDLIRGEVTGADNENVTVKHAYGTELKIPWPKVVAIETDKPVELRLVDGSRLKGKLEVGPKPKSATVKSESLGPVAADFDRVVALNEPPAKGVWSGQINLGLSITDGNTRTRSVFGSFDAERRSQRDRFDVHAYYAHATARDQRSHEDVLTTRKGFARVQFAYDFLKPFFFYVGAALEYDNFQNLRLRSRGGGGLGYAFFDEKGFLLRAESGCEYVSEDYRGDIEDRSLIALRAASDFQWQINDSLRLSEHVEIFPNVERFRDFVMRSASSANVTIYKGFGLTVIVIWEHDQLPASPDRKRNDTSYNITLSYVF